MAKRRGRRRGCGGVSWWLAAAGFVAGAAVVLLIVFFGGLLRTSVPPPAERRPSEPSAPQQPRLPEEPGAALPSPSRGYAAVAIVIDDMGRSMSSLRDILDLEAPITVAVLPHLKYSAAVAREAHRNGREVLLHLPMEPRDAVHNDPGEGALTTAMTAAEVRLLVESDLDEVPYAVGVNNHMGSKFTEDAPLMREVLRVVGEKRMFFLDSRTTSGSVGARISREMGLRNAERNIFLDNERDVAYIKGQIEKLVRLARKRGRAIAIGHPYPETMEALSETVPAFREAGVEVVRLSDLVDEGSMDAASSR